jgi:uncharacterized membrane protein
MRSKVKIADHPVRPILIAYPAAFYTATLLLFIVYNSNYDPFYFKVTALANTAGVVMAAVAAGFLRWMLVQKHRIGVDDSNVEQRTNKVT